jgi:hypothetical protein
VVAAVIVLTIWYQAGEIRPSLATAWHFNAFRTFSGLLTLLAMLALLAGRLTLASVLLIIDGSAGTGIFWDRWSRETGQHVEITALFSGVHPDRAEVGLLATHLPLLLIGIAMLALVNWKNGIAHGVGDQA